MARRNTEIRGARPASRRPRISPARLDALIDEAIVDAYNESERAVGFTRGSNNTSRCPSRPSCWE